MTRQSIVLQNGYRYNTQRETSSLLIAPASLQTTAHLLAPPMASKMASIASETPFRPSDYVSSKTYFDSPIRTLCESINDPGGLFISVHDLMEAYSVLSTRLRVIFNEATCTTLPTPCLAGFHEFSSDITQCISRDIQRPLPSPFDSQQDFSSYLDYDAATDLEELQLTMDNISLCHYALRIASDIFTFSTLYSIFPGKRSYFIAPAVHTLILPVFSSDDPLVSLLREALSLCTTKCSPLVELDKARAMVVWILKTQQLPTPILFSLKQEILATVKYAINCSAERSTIQVDALAVSISIHPVIAFCLTS